jgi:hypothetical protein
MKKKYDFDAVIEETKSGGRLDNCISNLQDKIAKLTKKVQDTETNYHGKGSNSRVRQTYQNVFNTIGYDNGSQVSGIWGAVWNIVALGELIAENAENDKKIDEGQL